MAPGGPMYFKWPGNGKGNNKNRNKKQKRNEHANPRSGPSVETRRSSGTCTGRSAKDNSAPKRGDSSSKIPSRSQKKDNERKATDQK